MAASAQTPSSNWASSNAHSFLYPQNGGENWKSKSMKNLWVKIKIVQQVKRKTKNHKWYKGNHLPLFTSRLMPKHCLRNDYLGKKKIYLLFSTTGHDIIHCGISLWSAQISCSYSVLSQLLAYSSSYTEGAQTALMLCQHQSATATSVCCKHCFSQKSKTAPHGLLWGQSTPSQSDPVQFHTVMVIKSW